MILLLTLAGRDARFESEGYKTPKYLLPWGDKTILSAILEEYLSQKEAFSEAYLVVNREHEAYMPHVRAIMRARGIAADAVTITDDTRGQAETALIGINAMEKSRGERDLPLLVANVDTILYGRNFTNVANTLGRADGYIDVFRSSDRGYSYVLLEGKERVQEIAEKIVVSDVATSGAYGFRNASVYRKHYAAGTDVYISSVFKRMLTASCEIIAGERHSEDDTIVLSSPEQYMNAAVVRLQQ